VRSRRWVFIVVPLFLLYLASGLVLLPLYSIGPGPARDVAPLIRIGGEPVYGSSGHFVMTSVHVRQLTPLGALFAWLDPNQAVVGRSTLYAPGETDQQEQRRAISQMDQSKLDAAYVVLRHLFGYPKDHGAGVLIESVVPGCAADGELYPGDLVRSIDGTAAPTASAASKLIESAPSGSTLTFDITADGTPEVVHLVRRPCGGSTRPLVGVSMIPSFPFSISIASGDIGGPSAGLMWAVTMYDLLTPADLTGGRTIAGTGVIEPNGRVEPIGGIAEKIVAAREAGADVLLLPKGNLAEARAEDGGGIRLVPVASFDEALSWLRANA
jgi:PDZ domain-containing secreted protein